MMESDPSCPTETTIRAAIAELHRQDALQTVGSVQIEAQKPVKGPWDALYKTSAGQAVVQAKLDDEKYGTVAERIRQLKELVHDTFVVMPRTAEPVNGWVPRVRFDLYQRSKETCRKIGQEGGARYEKAITAVRYALTGSKAYRDAIETLGL
jgi:hypothetical protein